MIPPTVTSRLTHLRGLAEECDANVRALQLSASQVRAEIDGMQFVIEAVTPLLDDPPQQDAAPTKPRRRRSVRNLVLDLVRREPGLPPAQIAELIGCRKSQVDNAVAYWRSSGEIDLRFSDGIHPRDLMQEAAQ